MLPYFNEFVKYTDKLKDKDKQNISLTRLKPFEKDENNILNVNVDYISRFFKYSYTTNCNVKSTLRIYLKWLKENYKEDISEISYVLSNFTPDNSESLYFQNLEELLTETDKIEDEVIETIIPSPETAKTLVEKHRQFLWLKVIYILLWNNVDYEDMTTILKENIYDDYIFVPASKRKIFYDKYSLCGDVIKQIKTEDISDIDNESDNIFKTNSAKVLSNLSFLAIGKVEDRRLWKRNVQKAGCFERFSSWEQANQKQLTNNDVNIVSELCGKKLTKGRVASKLVEYRKYLSSLIFLMSE